MRHRKALIVCGTRPEAIKVAPILIAMRQSADFEVKLCVTAQHRQMLDQVLEVFGLVPDYDLNVMTPNQDLFDLTSNVLLGMRDVLTASRPDAVIVQGDTTTALIAGLAAFYLRIPVCHVEAGLRTYRKFSPFPEEINRHMLSTITDYHFAPTEVSRENLIRENISPDTIWVTGNTVIDALHIMSKRLEQLSIHDKWRTFFKQKYGVELHSDRVRTILVTGHRRENFGDGFQNICHAITDIAKAHPEVQVVYPVHLNPQVRIPVHEILSDLDNVKLIEPLDYEPFIFLMKSSHIILTDSGGIQEEAPSFGKPVLVMRDTTERPEGIAAGTVQLVGTVRDNIVRHTLALIEDEAMYEKASKAVNPYGDGKATERILHVLTEHL